MYNLDGKILLKDLRQPCRKKFLHKNLLFLAEDANRDPLASKPELAPNVATPNVNYSDIFRGETSIFSKNKISSGDGSDSRRQTCS